MERAQSTYLDAGLDEVAVTWQYVAGVEFFPLPYVEVRPEYRLVKTADYMLGYPAIQLHLFY